MRTDSRIVITDPHGCKVTLDALIDKLPPDVPLTFGGDLLDRGPKSRELVSFVKDNGHDCVSGNHEKMCRDEVEFTVNGLVEINKMFSMWLPNGGDEALESYEGYEKLLQEHVEWFKTLPFYLEYPEVVNSEGRHLVVSHAAIAEGWHLRNTTDEHLKRSFESNVVWNRNLYPFPVDEVFNVFGHSPQKGGPLIHDHAACIDNGVYLGAIPVEGYGKLYALQFPEMILFEQEYID